MEGWFVLGSRDGIYVGLDVCGANEGITVGILVVGEDVGETQATNNNKKR